METIQKKSASFKGIKSAGWVIVICFIVAVLIFHFVLGNPSNFMNNDPNNHPLPGNFLGTIYKGGFIVPVIQTLLLTVIALSIERYIAIGAAFGKGSLAKFVANIKAALAAGDMKKARDTDNKMIAFSVMCCTGVALVMLTVAPFFPKLYNTNLDAQELAKYFIMIMAIFMPQNAFLHASYFTLRSGGKTIITFLFDSVFVWCVSVPIAYCLSRFTGLHVLAVFAMVQVGDILKCIVGFVLVKKGVWMQNIVSGK